MAGLLLGAGLLLVWLSCWPRHSGPRPRSRWRERTQDLLVRAGAPGVSPGRLVAASTALAAVVLLITLGATASPPIAARSEEHTSELQSRGHLVCRLLLEKKNKTQISSPDNMQTTTT